MSDHKQVNPYRIVKDVLRGQKDFNFNEILSLATRLADYG